MNWSLIWKHRWPKWLPRSLLRLQPWLEKLSTSGFFLGRWRLVEAWERKPISSHTGSCWRRRANLLHKHPTLYCQAFSSVFQLCFCCFLMFGVSLHTSITTLKAMQKSGHPRVLKCLHTQEFLVKADQAYGRWKSQVMATERPNFLEIPWENIPENILSNLLALYLERD